MVGTPWILLEVSYKIFGIYIYFSFFLFPDDSKQIKHIFNAFSLTLEKAKGSWLELKSKGRLNNRIRKSKKKKSGLLLNLSGAMICLLILILKIKKII